MASTFNPSANATRNRKAAPQNRELAESDPSSSRARAALPGRRGKSLPHGLMREAGSFSMRRLLAGFGLLFLDYLFGKVE